MPRTYSSVDKIRAELAWVNETPDPNKCGAATFDPGRAALSVVVPVLAVPLVTKISIPVAVPMMVMFKSTALSGPVTHKKRPTIVTRWDPVSPRIRWSSPITFMPPVTVFHHIPITVYPDELGSRLCWHHVNHSRWRRLTNSDS